MSNTLFDKGRQAFLDGTFGWSTANFKIVLVSSGYTFSAAHQYLSSITGGNRVATSGNLANKTSTNGVADADDITLTGVTGSTVTQFVIYRDTGGADTTCDLVAYFDTATNLPLVPNGGDVIVQFDSGSNKIFRL